MCLSKECSPERLLPIFHMRYCRPLLGYPTVNMERVWGSVFDKTDVDRRYSASNAIGKEWHIHAWLELKINLCFSLFIFNDSCCYVQCCVASLSIFMTSLLHTHSFSAVERIVSLDTEGTETESSMYTCLRRIVNCIYRYLFIRRMIFTCLSTKF
jgi:hypothetical protein